MNYLSLLTTVVTFVFMVSVFRRYLYRKSPYLLVWSFGLLLFGLGTLSEVILSLTYNPAVIKIWYLCGAMLTAAWLGQGTIFLLARRRGVAPTLAILSGAATLAALGFVFTAPILSTTNYQTNLPISTQYQAILIRSTGIIVLTILLNIYGTIGLVGGAIFSGYLFWRKKILLNRVVGNLLIAAGALSPALAGSFIKAGLTDALYLSEFLGVVLMYLGFLQATSAKPAAAPATVQIPVK